MPHLIQLHGVTTDVRILVLALTASTLHERDEQAAVARVRSMSNGLADDLERLAAWIREEQAKLSTTD